MKKSFSFKSVYVFLISIYLLSLPLNAVNIGKFGSAMKLFAILPIGFALVCGSRSKLHSTEKWQLAFTVFASLSVFWSISTTLSFSRGVTYISLFMLLFSATMFEYNEKDVKILKRCLVYSSRAMALILLFFGKIIRGRLWLHGVITEDPNYICAYFAFGEIYCLNILVTEKRLSRRLLALAELLFYVFVTFMTGSRGGLLAMLASLGIFILSYSGRGSRRLFGRMVCLLLILLILYTSIDLLPESLKMRFSLDDLTQTGGSGRIELWINAVDMYIRSDPITYFIGSGTSTARYNMALHGYRRVNVVHNIFLETLVELGIIGLIFYTLAIVSFIKKAFTYKDKFAFAVIVFMFMLSLTTSLYAFKPYFNIMLYIIVLQNSNMPRNDEIIVIKRRRSHLTEPNNQE